MDKDRLKSLRDELATISDKDLINFADWIYNNGLQTVTEFIEEKAAESEQEECF